jgi:hypothetical protein
MIREKEIRKRNTNVENAEKRFILFCKKKPNLCRKIFRFSNNNKKKHAKQFFIQVRENRKREKEHLIY